MAAPLAPLTAAQLVEQAIQDAEQAAQGNGLDWDQAAPLHAKLLLTLTNPRLGWGQVPPDSRPPLLARLVKLIPRLARSPQPAEEMDALAQLWRHPNPETEMARAAKILAAPASRPLQEGEELYLGAEGWLGAWMEWSRYCDVPLGYFWWAGLAALGAACRYGWFIDRGTEPVRLNTYMIFVGDKATGKSTALQAGTDVLRRMNYLVSPWKPGDDPKVFLQDHPWHVRLLPEDTTQEMLVAKLGYHTVGTAEEPIGVDSTGLLALDELATFLGREGWMIEKRVPWLTTMYGRPPYVYETKTGGKIELRNIALSLLGCCTPDWMKVAVSPLMFGGGFLDRTVVVYRDPLPGRFYSTPAPRDPVLGNELARFLARLSSRSRPEELYAEPAAEEWFHQWYVERPESLDPRDTSVKRMANHLWKVAGLLALSSDSAPVIRLPHFQWAQQLLEVEENHYRRFLRYLERPPEEDLLRFIEEVLGGAGVGEDGKPRPMTQGALYARLRGKTGLTPPHPRAAGYIESLVQQGRVELTLVEGKKAYRLKEGEQ